MDRLFFKLFTWKGSKILIQERREDLKVQGACSALRDEDGKVVVFFTLHTDGYHVMKTTFSAGQTRVVVKPHCSAFFQMCRKATTERSRCIVTSCCTTTYQKQ